MNSIPPIRGGIFGEPESERQMPTGALRETDFRVYVVTVDTGRPWNQTVRSNRREAIQAAVSLSGQSWAHLKKRGCHTALAVITLK